MGRLRFPRNTPFHDRLVATEAGCLEWQGYRDPNGYGRLNIDGKPMLAHRLSWELHCAPVPEGLSVLHKCDNPPCVNPYHLFIGTQLANISASVKIKDLEILATEGKTGYFDVTYKLYAFNVPQPVVEAIPDPEPPTKGKKKKNDAEGGAPSEGTE